MEHSKEYRLIGERLIRTLPEFQSIRDEKPKIAYLVSDEEKKRMKVISYKLVYKLLLNVLNTLIVLLH